jgi:hypothetical protein
MMNSKKIDYSINFAMVLAMGGQERAWWFGVDMRNVVRACKNSFQSLCVGE